METADLRYIALEKQTQSLVASPLCTQIYPLEIVTLEFILIFIYICTYDRENRMEAMENKKQAQCKNSIYDKLFGKCVRLSEHSAHFDRLKELCAYMPEVGHCSL